MNCPLHEKLDERIRSCEETKILSVEHFKKVDTLFEYHDRLLEIIQQTKETLVELRKDQHSWVGSLNGQLMGIRSGLDAHIKAYDDFTYEMGRIVKEVDSFRWFRRQMNWLKDKLPWWVLSVFAVAVALLFISMDGIKKIAIFLKAWIGL